MASEHVLVILLLSVACGFSSSADSPGAPKPSSAPGSAGKTPKEKEKEEKLVEINQNKRGHPAFMMPPGQAFRALKDMGLRLKPEDKDLVKDYLSNASVLFFKMRETGTSEVNGTSVVDTLLSLGRNLIATLPDPDRNDTRGKRSEYYEGLDLSMEVVKQKRENFTGYEFPPTNGSGNGTDVSGRESKIRLPAHIFKNSAATQVTIVSLFFNPIPEMEQRANTSKRRINVKVMSTSIDPPLPRDLDASDEPVVITFSRTTEATNSVDTCVYWDPKVADFSTSGCKLRSSNASFVVCECTHLTEFAVLSGDVIDTSSTTISPTTSPINGAGTFLANQFHIVSCLVSAMFFATLIW